MKARASGHLGETLLRYGKLKGSLGIVGGPLRQPASSITSNQQQAEQQACDWRKTYSSTAQRKTIFM